MIRRNHSYRWFTVRAYNIAKFKDAEGEGVTHRERIGRCVLSFGPVYDVSRTGKKWGGEGWRVHVDGQDGFTYFTGQNAETKAREHIKRLVSAANRSTEVTQ